MSDGWLHVTNDDLDMAEPVMIPDDPDVRATYEGRGWRVVDPPEATPFTPAKVNIEPGSVPPEWVELVHPDTDARHDFPNNPDALAGATERGWVEPNKDGTVPKPATVKRRAKAAEQATEESPDSDTAAGESTDRPADSSATSEEELNRG